jgi:hypothetical protein
MHGFFELSRENELLMRPFTVFAQTQYFTRHPSVARGKNYNITKNKKSMKKLDRFKSLIISLVISEEWDKQ